MAGSRPWCRPRGRMTPERICTVVCRPFGRMLRANSNSVMCRRARTVSPPANRRLRKCGSARVEVSTRDVEGVTLALAAGPEISGIRYRQAAADRFGNFLVKGVPPGEYKLFAWEDAEPGA